MKTGLKLCIIILFAGWPLFAQETQTAGGPVSGRLTVSDIRLEMRSSLIKVLWKDSTLNTGPVYVYRSSAPLAGVEPDYLPQPVEVPYGAESYITEADDSGAVYFFIVSSDSTGKRCFDFITNLNAVSVQISPDSKSFGQGYPVGLSSAEITLWAEVNKDAVRLNFDGDDKSKTTIIYRSTKPFRRIQDILSAVTVQSGATQPVVDHPLPGIPYYYVVVYEEELAQGAANIVPGKNATTEGVTATGGSQEITGESLRKLPLPVLSLPELTPWSNAGLGRPKALSAAASAALKKVSPSLERPPYRKQEPFIFPEESENMRNSDPSLSLIALSYIKANDWEQAMEELNYFLALSNKPEAEARAHFYLGEAYYFLDRPRDALLEFLLARDLYPTESAAWVQENLRLITHNSISP
jgi:hypothetical protein